MKKNLKINILISVLSTLLLGGCVGGDADLLYFPKRRPPEEKPMPRPGVVKEGRSCVLSYTSQLCVTIKGKKIDVGNNLIDPLCAEVSPFPLHIFDQTIEIRGDEFPDIAVAGHGLPVPIVINGKGSGDGNDNIGKGTIDALGNVEISGFSFFINALGTSVEVPNLTITTGETKDLTFLPSISGSPPDVSGATQLATATALGHTFDAADEVLLGSSMTALFSGVISPTLNQCGGEKGKASVEIFKLHQDKEGKKIESRIPENKGRGPEGRGSGRLEISTGTFIAEIATDVGPRFEAKARFRIKNIGSKTISLRLPAKKGPFFLESLEPLSRNLSPQQSLLLDVTFRPKLGGVEPGEVTEQLIIGTDLFTLYGIAKNQQGDASLAIVDQEGNVTEENVDRINVGEVSVAANMKRNFFLCEEITCHEQKMWTSCRACPDPVSHPCELLPIDKEGIPLGEVDASCTPKPADLTPLLSIDLKGTTSIKLTGGRTIVALRNRGVKPMTVKKLMIEELPASASKGEFSLPERAIFIDNNVATLPFTLPPFQKGVNETTAYIVISYQPGDLIGSDGGNAGVGSFAHDRAVLHVVTDEETMTAELKGSTTILEVPALEAYFKTPIGLRHVSKSKAFPFRGVTAETTDLAVPFFLRLSDTAKNPIRITSIEVRGKDAEFFQWLGTEQKVQEARCSIDETLNLRPVSLTPPGFDVLPGEYSTESMPLFGCVNFHRDLSSAGKRLFEAVLAIDAVELNESRNPQRNPDGSLKETHLEIPLLAAINPRKGKMIFRVSQAMSVILNPEFPGVSSTASNTVYKTEIAAGRALPSDQQIFTIALILDPFDEEEITDPAGEKIVSSPNDGITAVLREIDTHPTTVPFENPFLFDYTSLIFDDTLPAGEKGVFEKYPNIPVGTKSNALRFFTSALSFPGPLAPNEKQPVWPSDCIDVDPCDPEALKKFSNAHVTPGEKGACTYFYASTGSVESPAFHKTEDFPEGAYTHMCNLVNQSQGLLPANNGRYTLDGQITVEEMAIRLFGPTYFHNPYGPFGGVQPIDIVSRTAFTTGVLKPQASLEDPDVLPNEKIDETKQTYKINLNDPTHANPKLCDRNTKNKTYLGKKRSSWKYLAPLLSKDEEGTSPAGCPDEGNDFKGGTAYLHGRPVDHETGVATFVATIHTENDPSTLTFAFDNIPIFFVLNGWVCDPEGSEEEFEGSHCYDVQFNPRDEIGQISIIDD